MELFTVSLPANLHPSVDRLQMLLTEHLNVNIHMDSEAMLVSAVEIHVISENHIRCDAVLPLFQLKKHGPAVYKAASKAIAEFIVIELEPYLLETIIRKKYSSHPTSDVDAIKKYCHELLHGKEWEGLGARFHEADLTRRKGKISDEIENYFHEQTRLNIAGMTRFRLLSYRTELTEIIEYALDEYLLDKQYQEFINLLKYFVFLQDTKVSMVHLLHKGGHDFTIYNASFQALESKPSSDRIVAEMLETEMNIEDMVISSLISISPKHITIHTRQPDMQVIRTIETIFDKRVKVCLQCASCTSSLDGLIQP